MMTYSIQQFVKEARETVDQRLGDARTLAALARKLERVIALPDCLAEVSPDGNPSPERGFPIYRADDLSIICVVWAAGSGAPVHNHNGWALEGVISGMERNRNYARLDDGSEPWRARLEEVEPSVVRAGETTALDLPPNDIHAVEIPEGKTLAIHVYGNDLYKQWRYLFDLETGEVRPYRMGMRVPTPAKP